MTTVENARSLATPGPIRRRRLPDWTGRLLWCLFGGFVLSLMIGSQEGTIDGDFGIAFLQAVGLRHQHGTALHFPLRLLLFLGIGVVLWVLVEFWAVARRYVRRPGFVPLVSGIIGVIIAQRVMNWYDLLATSNKGGQYSTVKKAVDASSGLQWTTTAFFDWLSWTLFAVGVIAAAAAIATRLRPFGYLSAVIGLAGAVIAFMAHKDVVKLGGVTDHSLGVYVDLLAFLAIGAAGLFAVYARSEVADTRAFLQKLADFRPGLPIAVGAIIWGALAFTSDCWFGPGAHQTNANYHELHSKFSGLGLTQLASQYVKWLGVVLFVAAAVLAVVTVWLCHKVLAWVTVAVSVVGVVLTFFTLKSMTEVGVKQVPAFGTRWNNLGVGGYVACIVFASFAAAVIQVLAATRAPRVAGSKTGIVEATV